METTRSSSEAGLRPPAWLAAVMHLVIVAAMPLLLVLINARLLMSEAYIRWEYSRPGFPEDPYGFTQEDRLRYAIPSLNYLFSPPESETLGDLTFPDGTPIYNERELSHMHDVKVVTRQLVRYGFALLGIWGVCVVGLAIHPTTRRVLYLALFRGSFLTVALIIVGLVATATSFNWLFAQFHALFFVGNSWIFPTSDTLIRLFPQKFWVDAFVLIFGGTFIEALLLGGAAWLLLKRASPPR